MAYYVKTQNLLNDLQKSIVDQSPALRVKLLSWLNAAMQGILNEPREWTFLKADTTLAITANAVTLPTDFDLVIGIHDTLNTWYFDSTHELSDVEAFSIDATGMDVPIGYTLTATTMTFHPAATGSIVLTYQKGWPGDYADSTADTIIPREFTNMLQRSVLSQYYEYDKDERAVISLQLDPQEMKKMKARDNNRRTSLRSNRHGYVRTATSGSIG